MGAVLQTAAARYLLCCTRSQGEFSRRDLSRSSMGILHAFVRLSRRWTDAEEEEECGALGERLRLTLRRMFETAVGDSTKKLGLQQEIPKTRGVYADITSLRFVCVVSGDCQVAFLLFTVRSSTRRACSGRICGLELLVGVIDEILFVGHFGGVEGRKSRPVDLEGLVVKGRARWS